MLTKSQWRGCLNYTLTHGASSFWVIVDGVEVSSEFYLSFLGS